MQRNNRSYYSDNCDLNSFSKKQKSKKQRHKRGPSAGKIVLTIVCAVLVILLALPFGVHLYIQNLFGKLDRVKVEDKIEIQSQAQTKYKDYVNIALLGIDTRGEGFNEGRSDAIIILTLDMVHDKIKLTSIARDSYVEIKGKKNKDKITHAYMYGKDPDSRAALAVDTINRNYDMNIKDVVTMNFYGFAEIIDSIGGVWVDVSNAERKVMNKTYIPYIKKQGIKCDYVKKTGYQLLSGGQALAYSRDRYTGSDKERGDRQREVLTAMYEQVKSVRISEMPKLISTILENCSTSMTNSQMFEIATWAVKNKPTVENLGLPDEDCKARGATINGTWYFVYDLDIATKKIHDFITETGDYVAPSSVAA